jgi:signal transduction histidine kinase
VPVGTSVRYRLHSGAETFERDIATRRFDSTDGLLLFGAYLLNGLAFGAMALLILYLRGDDRRSVGTAVFFWIAAMFTLSALDLYGPYRLFRLHALCEVFLFAGALHMAAVFPQPLDLVERRPQILWFPYGFAALLGVVSQLGLYEPTTYRATHLTAMLLLGASVVALIATQVLAYLQPRSFEVRQRVRVVAFGALVALSPLVLLILASAVTGRDASQNLMAFTGFLFPIAVGYAVLRHDLLEVDAFIRRSLNYALLTVGVTGIYVAVVATAEVFLKDSFQNFRGLFGIAFGVLCVAVLLPMRDQLQSWIDRLFFRTVYNYRRIVESTSSRLAAVADLSVIGRELATAVDEALHPESVSLHVFRAPGDQLVLRLGQIEDDAEFDLPDVALEAYEPIDLPDRGLAVPFRSDDALVAVLRIGPSLSGRMYSGEDRGLLQTLANQGSVAIQNALALEQLRDLNRSLEEKVEERTRELREAQAQLVHGEKMASIGQFVAGIAHELNNPMNFIVGNFHYLRSYAQAFRHALDLYREEARAADPELGRRFDELWSELDVDHMTEELGPVLEGCAEGIERATALVRDLRTFSRADRGTPTPLDLYEALDSTLNLLRGPLSGVQLVREYGEVPTVECMAGQISQVFMNLLSNAADATGGSGTVTVRTALIDAEHVAVEIEDDGCGIPADQLDLLFDPFYTTKDVGKGMGLGLSITYGIIVRHAGSIDVTSEPGQGTRFRVVLPVQFVGQADGGA